MAPVLLQRPLPLSPLHIQQKHHIDLHQPQKLSHPTRCILYFKLILLIYITILRCSSCKFSCCLILLNVLFSREWVGSETQLDSPAGKSFLRNLFCPWQHIRQRNRVVLQRSFNPVWPLWSLSNKLTSTQPEPPLQFKHLHILARMRHRWKILKGMGKKSIIPIPLKVQTASGYPAIDLLLLHSIACGTVLQHSLQSCYISSQCSVFSLCWTTRNACKIGKRIASVVQH